MLDHRLKKKITDMVSETGLRDGERAWGYAVDGQVPAAVIFPTTPDEVEKVVTLALEEGLTIIPWGGGTQMGLGAPPRHVDLVVCLGRLEQILDQDAENMSLTAQAGIRLGVIQEKLRNVGQGFFLPLDPPCAEEVTLGGAVAANASGAGRLRYGTLRDLVLGVEVVIPEETGKGTRAVAGGKTVKNVSGYDMSKLYIGSLGTLGIVVAITCKILPLPEDRATVVAGFSGEDAPWACAQAVRESQLTPSSIEVYDRETASLFLEAVKPSAEEVSWVAVRLEGISEAVAHQIAEIEALARSQGVAHIGILRGSDEVEYWQQMGRLGVAVGTEKPLSIGLKVSVPLSLASEISKTIGERGARMNLPFRRLSHAGSGIVYTHVPLSEDIYVEKEEALAHMVKTVREQAEDMGGSVIVEYAPPAFKKKVDVWGEAGSVFPVMKGLKREFDPKGILNPGRFVGGI